MTLPIQLGSTSGNPQGYSIHRSLRFRSSASAYLSRTQASGNRQIFTWSGWFKMGSITGGTGPYSLFGCNSASIQSCDIYQGQLRFYVNPTSSGILVTSQVFRDPSAWYHLVIAVDTTQATAANRIKIYVNGSQVTAFGTSTYPAQNFNYQFNTASVGMTIGQESDNAAYFDGYMAELNWVDGQALTPSSFGSTNSVTGVWQPKKYSGTYGTNGFYLPFSDNTSATTLAYDKSGNGNNWTPNNISTTAGATYDSMTDVPTLTSTTAANYCVLNPLAYNASYCLDGNLAFAGANATSVRASFAIPATGKWYWEVNQISAAVNYVGFGLADAALTNGSSNAGTAAAGMWSLYPTTTMNYNFNGTNTNSGIAPPALGGCMAAAYDADTGNFWFGYAASGAGSITWFASGNPSTGANPQSIISAGRTLFPYMSSNNTTADKSGINFGQRPFNCTPPTGFKALNTYNLPDPVIKKPNQYMDATTYTGNGSTQTITNAGGFQPDFVWTKTRVAVASPQLFDSVRGAYLSLRSNVTGAETNNNPYGVTAFNSNGFSVADIAAGDYGVNGGSGGLYSGTPPNYVAWQWKESATAGFDIVTYTGTGVARTVSHSLGVAPKMMIIKCRNTAGMYWAVYHEAIGNTKAIWLQLTGAASSASATYWNNTSPTSTDFTVGTDTSFNGNTQTYVAYLFAEIPGFSKFGSYTGNGSADGPFVYCGFRPKYILIKNTVTAGSPWNIYDATRSPYNVVGNLLLPNASDAEYAQPPYMDFLSNGVKMRGTGAGQTGANYNGNTETYIYAAFAENPFKFANAR